MKVLHETVFKNKVRSLALNNDGSRLAVGTSGAEVYDAADVCPKCYAWLDGETARHPPGGRRRSERLNRLVVWTLIATMLLGAGLFGLLAWISPGRE